APSKSFNIGLGDWFPCEATPIAPTFNAINTCGVNGSITIHATTGVIYKRDGVVVSDTIPNLTGNQTITAEAAPGYTLVGVASWMNDLGVFKACATADEPAYTPITA